MMKPEMINLFAVPVAKSPIGRNYTDSELKYIESQLERPSKAIDNYASPNKNVLAHDELKDLQTIIQQHLDNSLMIVTDVTIPADTFALPIVTIPELPTALTRILVCIPTL